MITEILPANTLSSGGYDVANSLRFNTASDDYLNRTVGTPTQSLKYTISAWVKRSVQSTDVNSAILGIGNSGSSNAALRFKTDDTLQFYDHVSNADQVNYITNRVFRDNSAWYHVVVSSDRSLGSPETKIFINGVQETSFGTSTEYNQNDGANWNTNGKVLYVGSYNASYDHIDGYLAEVVFADGQILAPTSFGEFDSDSGIWKPISVSGLTFGDQGFYLEFKGTGTSANSSGIGADTSGNDNHLTVTALAATSQGTDTCTNNFAVLNPLLYGSNYTWSEGNLQFAQTATNWDTTYSSIGVTSGKWYMEFKGKVGAYYDVGVTDVIDPANNLSVNTGGVAWKSNSEFAQGGNVGNGLPSNVTSPASNTYTADDIIGIALDVDNEAVYFRKNGGDWEVNSDPTSGASKTGAVTLPNSSSTYFFAFAAYKGSAASGTGQVNFGGGSVDAISSGNADGNGFGNFEFAPPSGYFALCTKNLAEYG